jgi:hypothetical protein
MTVPVEAITKERLDRWAKRMKESHATPLLLIGVGHDQVSGQIVICTLDEPELSNDKLRAFLKYALKELQ